MISRSQQSRSRFIISSLVLLLIFILSGCNQLDDTSGTPGPATQNSDGINDQQPNVDNDTPTNPDTDSQNSGSSETQPPNTDNDTPTNPDTDSQNSGSSETQLPNTDNDTPNNPAADPLESGSSDTQPPTAQYTADHSESGLEFSHRRGLYTDAFNLTISHPTAQEVLYTMDASNPMRSTTAIQASLPVTIPIDPSDTTHRYLAPGVVIRAMPVDGQPASSKISTHTYIFPDRVVELSPDGEWPGGNWPKPGTSMNLNNGQWIDYGMDPYVTDNDDYSSLTDVAMVDIPSVSLVTDLDYLFDPEYGIFLNAEMKGEDVDPLGAEHAWEREGSMEIIQAGESDHLQANAGIRIRGGWSRTDINPKHAFKVYFRGVYGVKKVHYPFFGDEGVDEFDRIDFRTSNNYSWNYQDGEKCTMNRDVFSRDLQRELGRPYTRSRYYHLYLDGIYWGLFQSQERVDDAFAKSYFGGSKSDFDVIKTTQDNRDSVEIEVSDGTADAWQAVWYKCVVGFAADADYYALEGKDETGLRDDTMKVHVDIDNLIDYMLVVFYTGNIDGPVTKFQRNQQPNNFYAVSNRSSVDQGFVFFAHDNEHTLRVKSDDVSDGVDEDRVNITGDRLIPMEVSEFRYFHPQWLHQRLTENANYRARFAARAKELLENGILTPTKSAALFNSRIKEIELAIIAESARWGDAQLKSNDAYTKNDNWIPIVNGIKNDFFPVRSDIVIEQLRAAGLYPD